MKKLIVGLCCALLPTAAFAQHAANHLVITEVAYDTVDESATALPDGGLSPNTSEFIEIHNPTSAAVTLNSGAVPGTLSTGSSYFISDAHTDYWKIVDPNNATTASGNKVLVPATTDWIYQFPANSSIPAQGIVVVAEDSKAFLDEFFPGANEAAQLAKFKAQPGSPQLFEVTQDGTADGTPDMLVRSRYSSTVTPNLNMTNGGENVVLYFWDGTGDLIKDVDIVLWGSAATTQWPDKTGVTIDGPDADTLTSAFAAETKGAFAAQGASNLVSLQRKNVLETGEGDSGGNGITGHVELAETYTLGATWVNDIWTPGLPWIRVDGTINDAVSFLPAVGVSNADGPGGAGSPQDFAADGTLTELYVRAFDSQLDAGTPNTPDSLYIAVRGSMFGEPEALDTNASMVLIDLDPTGTGGVKRLVASGDQLSDTIGAFDQRITSAGFALPTTYSGGGFDLAVGTDTINTSSNLNAGVRAWGTGATGIGGSFADFAYLGTPADFSFDGNVSPLLAGKPGTSYAAGDGFEAVIRFSDIGGTMPAYVYVVAVTTADTGGVPSPNTVPESTSDGFTSPHLLDKGACVEVATGNVVVRYVDLDGDGVGGLTLACGPLGANISATTGDCDDNDASAFPGNPEVCDNKDNNCAGGVDDGLTFTTYFADADADTYGVNATTISSCQATAPTGYATRGGDCNDAASAINPGAQEVCDAANVDEDCDAVADDNDATTTGKTTYYRDADADTFGAPATTQQSCEAAPSGFVSNSNDCDDADATTNPNGTEICDGKDNNCNGSTDEGVSQTVYRDSDGDGFGNPAVTTPACAATPPSGYVANNSDCNDSDATIKPGATEIPGDGVDQNCDAAEVCFADADNDGYRPNGTATVASSDADCADANEAVASDPVGDCNDNAATINPGATETVADNIDQNCDGAEVCYADLDDDGYRPNATATFNSADLDCADAKEATSTDPTTDCDDTNSSINPGATEVAGNNVDENCDATVVCYADADNDGYRPNSTATTSSSDGDCDDAAEATSTDPVGDCNDTVATVNPGATEVCDASNVDEDCDATADDADSSATGKTAFYTDADSDTFGSGSAIMRCDAAPGQVTNNTDCNDSNANVKPGATEVCNNVDDDCDGTPDDSATDATAFYRDADSDTFGSATVTQMACSAPTGYVANSSDCDDTASSVFPGATETCNMTDDDCDTMVDEGVKTTFYADTDADGVGGTTTQDACAAPTGYVSTTGDCDDTDLNVKPGATETCDTKDNNCDGAVDEGVKTTFYVDADNDGAGGSTTQDACTAPTGYVASNNDCDDTDAARKPSGTEVCDGKDNNCNGTVDEGVQTTFYTDADGDGQGGQSSVSACTAPAGTATNSDDCNDGNANVKKADKEEVCNDALDNDCDGKVDGDDSDDCQAEQIAPESACGCSSGSSAMFAPALLMALAFIGRRRRNA